MTCKDCIHYDVCQYHITEETGMTVAECSHTFKNKADFVEVKHGEWIYNTDDFTPKTRCSVCGHNKPLVAGESVKQEPNDYCNKCGAKMDGVRK